MPLSHRVSAWLSGSNSRTCSLSCRSASFSTTCSRFSYGGTIKNLKIGSQTRVIFQGFTSRQATANAIESLAWGTRIVGGVTPGRSGFHPSMQDLAVYPTVRDAVEAIEAEIPLIVAVAEHIPVHDMMRIHSMLRSQSRSRLVGANAPGIISPLGRCRIGFQPLPAFSPGHVGIVAKSGTLSYETVASLTRAGVGQSLCIGMGGDMVAGTDFVDALSVFEHDPDTHGIIIVGEIGGRAEEEAADWISQYRKRTPQAKPIAAVVAGKLAQPGRVMGHAGAWAGPGELSADIKFKLLQDAGAVMVDHPSQFGELMVRELLPKAQASKAGQTTVRAHAQQPGLHTFLRPHRAPMTINASQQRRGLHIHSTSASDLLLRHGIRTTREARADEPSRVISVSIDRSSRGPCFFTKDPGSPRSDRWQCTPFDFREGPTGSTIVWTLRTLCLPYLHSDSLCTAPRLLYALHEIFMAYEGILIQVKLGLSTAPDDPKLLIFDPQFTFDDAALKSCGRHAELHALRDVSPSAIDPAELAAEADGIVYVKLGPTDLTHPDFARYNIGTLVNGAGLAMNTVDALALAPHRGLAANFLDTGGKATAETVKRSFELLLADPRVKVIFVNIFGGLTLGDMIARGILLAFRELRLEERDIPVVVRIRGTNEVEGQRIVEESGLKIFAFDGFDEAAAHCVKLARERE
ncbi:succinyl-CoA synthetase subunit alpha [Mycena rebaudengoi]|nr:succinyl-CoA synthetase subunit alpha [Mycena rebaudengoi]